MRSLETQLTNYAAYHRDPRNILTHFIGIPLIVVSLLVLASPKLFSLGAINVSLALILWVITSFYYLRLNAKLGLLMLVVHYLALLAGSSLAQISYWGFGIGLFVVGWVFQFVGHLFEGKKPAFIDDIMGLIIGPLFVVTEALFMFRGMPALQASIEAEVGPVRRAEVP